MIDYMVDLETTGTRGDRHAIIQIAAWRFDVATGEVDPEPFDRCLNPMPHREWNLDTAVWWKTKRGILQRIQQRAEDPRVVLRAFADWVGRDHAAPPRMWAKPSHFEHPFLESHFKDAGIESPFHYRHVKDVNTYLFAKVGDFEAFAKAVPFHGEAHDALWDTLHQLQVVLKATHPS